MLSELSPRASAYNVSGAFRLQGVLSPVALSQSLAELIRRHEALRSGFAPGSADSPTPRVILVPVVRSILRVIDIEDSAHDALLQRCMEQEARRPFDLRQLPPIRATLLRLSPREHILVLTVHHIACDERSMEVLTREWRAIYAAYSLGEPSILAAPALQYSDYAIAQRRRAAGGRLRRTRCRMGARSGGLPPLLDLATGLAPEPHPFRGRSRRPCQRSPGERSGGSPAGVGLANQVTLPMVLTAALLSLLSRYSRQDDLCVGIPCAQREHADTAEAVGQFVNTLPLRCDLSNDPSFVEVLARTGRAWTRCFSRPEVPLQMILDRAGAPGAMDHNRLFQVLLAFQAPAQQAPPVGSLRIEAMPSPCGHAKCDLVIFFQETPPAGGLRIECEYDAALLREATMRAFSQHLGQLLAEVALQPHRRLSALPPQTGEPFCDPHMRTPLPATSVYELFQAQAARSPDAVAIYGPEAPPADHSAPCRSLTYRGLDRLAARLANYVQRIAPLRDQRVAICLIRPCSASRRSWRSGGLAEPTCRSIRVGPPNAGDAWSRTAERRWCSPRPNTPGIARACRHPAGCGRKQVKWRAVPNFPLSPCLRKAWPTSSTRRDRPAYRRVWRSSIGAPCGFWTGAARSSGRRNWPRSWRRRRCVSTFRYLRCSPLCARAGP